MRKSDFTELVTAGNGLLLLIALVSYYAIIVVYRLRFHPLANFPGPRIAAATRLYEFHYDSTMRGRYWKKIEAMHQRYGPIVRINPNEIHINDPTFYDKLYNFDVNLDKDPLFTRELGYVKNLQATNPTALHKNRRAAFGLYFSRMQITKLEGLIHQYANRMCGSIIHESKKGGAVYLSLLYRCFTAEIVCEYCFSRNYGFFDDLDKAKELLVHLNRPGDIPGAPGVHHLGRFTNYVNVLIFVQIMSHMAMVKLGLSSEGSFARFYQYVSGMVQNMGGGTATNEEHMKGGSINHPTIFQKIVESDLPAEEKDTNALFENAVLFLFAGFETTGYTLTLATYHVLTNSSIKDRLKREVLAAWPDADEIPPWAYLEKLPLLNAVLKESLRLGSGVLSRLSRVDNHKAIQFEGWTIPPGTPVSMSQPLIHSNPDIFPDPGKFDPDRWLRAENPKALEQFLVPFSAGSRGCIGSSLAMAELHIAFATVIRRFDMTVYDTGIDDIASYYDEFTPVPKNGKQKLFVEVQ